MWVRSSENIAKRGRKSPVKGRPVLKPRGVARSKRYVQTLDGLPKSQNYSQGIIHNGAARGHTTMLDIGAQQSMVGMGGWDIIKGHDT